jgi:hypothetical protein
MRHMEVVEERTPRRVFTENGVREPDDDAVALSEDRACLWYGIAQKPDPYGQTVLDDVAVQEGVRVRAAIVPPPAADRNRTSSRSIKTAP